MYPDAKMTVPLQKCDVAQSQQIVSFLLDLRTFWVRIHGPNDESIFGSCSSRLQILYRPPFPAPLAFPA
jgi:hypothetical protein